MIIDLKSIPATVTPHFFGGEGQFGANIFKDDDNKILFGLLAPGCTTGLHTHEGTSEIVYIISGTGRALSDGQYEQLKPGTCHYCPQGHNHSLINDGQEDLTFFAVVPVHKA